MSITYIEEFTTIPTNIDFEPELYIYLQKLAKEQNLSINNLVNNIIREKAENKYKQDRAPYRPATIQPSVYPYQGTQPYVSPTWYQNNKFTCSSTYDKNNGNVIIN